MRIALTCIGLIGISLMLVGINYAAGIVVEDTIGIWLFDEGKGGNVEEFTGNGIDGTLMNAPTWVEGRFGQAVKFDGKTQFLEMNDPVNMKKAVHSISVWVNPGDKQNNYADLLGNHNNCGYDIEQRADQHNRFYHGMRIDNVWQGGPPAERPATQLLAGKWNHFVVIRDGSTIKHYLNGEKTVEYKISDKPIQVCDKNLRVALSVCCGGREFNGIVDELVMFHKAISEKEVKALSKGIEEALAVSEKDKLATKWIGIKTRY